MVHFDLDVTPVWRYFQMYQEMENLNRWRACLWKRWILSLLHIVLVASMFCQGKKSQFTTHNAPLYSRPAGQRLKKCVLWWGKAFSGRQLNEGTGSWCCCQNVATCSPPHPEQTPWIHICSLSCPPQTSVVDESYWNTVSESISLLVWYLKCTGKLSLFDRNTSWLEVRHFSPSLPAQTVINHLNDMTPCTCRHWQFVADGLIHSRRCPWQYSCFWSQGRTVLSRFLTDCKVRWTKRGLICQQINHNKGADVSFFTPDAAVLLKQISLSLMRKSKFEVSEFLL